MTHSRYDPFETNKPDIKKGCKLFTVNIIVREIPFHWESCKRAVNGYCATKIVIRNITARL